ncbi:hypothetical protein HPB47_013512 [Ixodes persulcatus]|uniref:Uncharacterized protein n=1 Tax=Ixodes persulcatus TaxID=34615 RepID=A0AC60QYB4_IXOPE|nr:hypothetical protein HPB47_013512 [Ixodes persulcatus]
MHARGAASRVAPPYTGESVKLEFPVAAVIFAGALLLRAAPAVREDSPTPGRVQPRAADRPPRSPREAPSPERCLARSSSAAAAARRTRRLTPFSADATGRTSCVHRVAV